MGFGDKLFHWLEPQLLQVWCGDNSNSIWLVVSTFQPIVSFPKGRDPKQILRTRPRKLLILCFQLFESRKSFKEVCSLCGQSSHHPLVTVVLYLPWFTRCFLILAGCSQALCLQSLLRLGQTHQVVLGLCGRTHQGSWAGLAGLVNLRWASFLFLCVGITRSYPQRVCGIFSHRILPSCSVGQPKAGHQNY